VCPKPWIAHKITSIRGNTTDKAIMSMGDYAFIANVAISICNLLLNFTGNLMISIMYSVELLPQTGLFGSSKPHPLENFHPHKITH
jgi:hypothetical protein